MSIEPPHNQNQPHVSAGMDLLIQILLLDRSSLVGLMVRTLSLLIRFRSWLSRAQKETHVYPEGLRMWHWRRRSPRWLTLLSELRKLFGDANDEDVGRQTPLTVTLSFRWLRHKHVWWWKHIWIVFNEPVVWRSFCAGSYLGNKMRDQRWKTVAMPWSILFSFMPLTLISPRPASITRDCCLTVLSNHRTGAKGVQSVDGWSLWDQC